MIVSSRKKEGAANSSARVFSLDVVDFNSAS
jgi:hypothetical protein